MKNLLLAKLQALTIEHNLAHAWLLNGGNQNDNLHLVQQFAQWLLCLDKHHEFACGKCKSCSLLQSNSHPDLYRLTPGEDSDAILVDDVRALNDFIVSRAQLSVYKVVLLWPAEKLNRQAANALLKKLEEPGANTIFLILTANIDLLLPTITSRCQIVNLSAPSLDSAVPAEVSQMAADLQALWVHKSATPLQTVERWLKLWPDQVLYWFELVIADLLIYKNTSDLALCRYPLLEQAAISNVVPSSKLWAMSERIRQALRGRAIKQKPNMQLILEDIIL